jgi:ribose-phosphate pyrophosphokinase
MLMTRLGIPLAKANIIQPPSGETKVTIVESVRDYDVYILNTVSSPLSCQIIKLTIRLLDPSTLLLSSCAS